MGDSGRRSVRARKVSQRISTVSLAERENAKNARLDALENDDATGEGVVGDSDEEFVIQDSDEGIPSTTAGILEFPPQNSIPKSILVR